MTGICKAGAAILTALILACTGGAAAGPSPAPSYAMIESSYLNGLARANQFSGVVLVADDRHTLLDVAIGYADATRRVANRLSTKFRIGSITKTLTATAVMVLVDDHSLALDDYACARLSVCPPAWASVTVRQLLAHTSGIPDYLPVISLAQFDAATPPEQLVGLVSGKPLLFAPGSGYAYSNTNYVLLGLLVEAASGMPYASFLKRRVFGPLRMAASGLARDFATVSGHATGYGYRTTTTTEVIPTDQAAFSDGGLYSTAGDLMGFSQGLFSGKLLPPALLAEMTAPWDGSAVGTGSPEALGWFVRRADGADTVAFHGGQIPGFSAMLERDLRTRLTVVVLSNYYWAPSPQIADLLAAQAR